MSNPLLASRNRILPALVTPLTESGELDVTSLEHLIDHLYSSGVGGLYVTGSTGEGIYLDPAVRKSVVEVAVAHSRGHGQVVAHVGSIAAMNTFELAAHAGRVGADAVSSIPPFVGGYSWDEVIGFYKRLGSVSPVPVVGYLIPALTGQRFTTDQLAELLHLPNMGGIKFTDTNLYAEQRLLARMAPDQVLYHGADEMLAFGLAFGAHGGIGTTYNFMPKLILEIAQLCADGRCAEAIPIQKKANEVIEILLSYHGLAASKQILVWQGHIATAVCAPPRAALTPAQQTEFRARLLQTAIADTLVR
jgi:N-acetylneuraminate lyase